MDIKAGGGAADFLAADLSALAEVRRLAEAVQATADRLDILTNNAGIGTAGPRQTSAEGFEVRFAVNYLAGFLLTSSGCGAQQLRPGSLGIVCEFF